MGQSSPEIAKEYGQLPSIGSVLADITKLS